MKVVATGLVSNTLGTINPVEKLAAWAHEQGAIMVVDAAQAAPHRTVDVQALDCDFLAISAHKMLGPSGVGALWGRRELLEAMSPFNLGGAHDPHGRARADDLGRAAVQVRGGHGRRSRRRWLRGRDRLPERRRPRRDRAHEHELTEYALGRLGELDWIETYGPPADRRAGIVSFNIEGVHPHDVCQILDWEGVAIRGGHHCTQPLMHRLGVVATNRASFYVYTIPEEIDRLVAGLEKVKKLTRLMSEFDQLYREVILDHYKNPRWHGLLERARRAGGRTEPALRRRGHRLAPLRRRHDQRGRLRGARLRDLAGGDLDADGARRRAQPRTRWRGCRRTSCSRRSGSRSRPVRLKCALLGLGVLKVALHKSKGTPLPEEWTGADDLTIE